MKTLYNILENKFLIKKNVKPIDDTIYYLVLAGQVYVINYFNKYKDFSDKCFKVYNDKKQTQYVLTKEDLLKFLKYWFNNGLQRKTLGINIYPELIEDINEFKAFYKKGNHSFEDMDAFVSKNTTEKAQEEHIKELLKLI